VNSDTNTNYSIHDLTFSGGGSTPSSGGGGNSSAINGPILATNNANGTGVFSATVVDILDFSSTNKNKTFRLFGGNWQASGSNSQATFRSGMWRSTSAITSILIYPNTTEFVSGSRFSLYGVK
jgi:hypothetical protein